MISARVICVAKCSEHRFSKSATSKIELVAGLGVREDAHQGALVKHRSRVAIDPNQPNLRQVHLIHSELFDELGRKGFRVRPADLGENITTVGIDLLKLPKGALLKIGASAVVEVTGLRNPCAQIERFRTGLLEAVIGRGLNGQLIRKAGIMAVVRESGTVSVDDLIDIELPPQPRQSLERV